MSADKAVVTLLYRSILRWNKKLASVPLDIRVSHVEELLPGFRKQHNGNFGSVRNLAKWGFRQEATGTDSLTGDNLTKDEHKALLLDRGFRALQLLSSEYAQALSYLQSTRAKHLNAAGIQFPVGTVIRHKKYGYKGVIYAWDKVCDRPPAWAQEMQVEHDQPFYSVLPDEHDCTRLFRGVRTSKYVAQVSRLERASMDPMLFVAALKDSAHQTALEGYAQMRNSFLRMPTHLPTAQENIEMVRDERVVHRAITNYFPEYSSDLGRYIPSAKVQYEYPGTYQASDAQACSADSNLLIHEEAELYNDPYADPYEDNPDSPHGRCPAEEAEAQSHKAAGTAADTAPPEDSSKAADDEALKARRESKGGPGDDLPIVGTDVKR